MIRLVIFDLDGTLYRGTDAIPSAVETVSRLVTSGVQVRYLTNNSALTHQAIAARLRGLGFPADDSQVAGTGPFAARVCQERGYASALVVGEPGLHEAFTSLGIHAPKVGEPAEVVVAGVCRNFTYSLCDQALQSLVRGAKFIATNRDATYPLEGGRIQPGAGAIVAAIEAASGVTPEVLGKPSPTMILDLVAHAGLTPAECLVVGDRMETDIEAGRAAGCPTMLVLSGTTPSAPPGVDAIHSVADLVI